MTCESHLSNLNEVIGQMDQVYLTEFSLADRMGHVVYDDIKITVNDILLEIDKCGFEGYVDGQQGITPAIS